MPFEERIFERIHARAKYAIPLVLLLIVTGASLLFTGGWIGARLTGATDGIAKVPLEIVMAVAGAYSWSIFEIHGRTRSRDLTPEDLYDVSLRFLVAVPVGYAGSLLAVDKVSAAFAFVVTALPLRDMRLFMRQTFYKKYGSVSDSRDAETQGHLRVSLQGMGDETIARLQELNITTYLDLAYADPVRLMAQTGFSFREILTWIDQALLRVYAGPNTTKLWRLSLPCALDAWEYYQDHFHDPKTNKERPWQRDQAVADLAQALDLPVTSLPELFKRIYADPHVAFLAKLWYEFRPEESKWLPKDSRPAGIPPRISPGMERPVSGEGSHLPTESST
jgi:hypothetical protein